MLKRMLLCLTAAVMICTSLQVTATDGNQGAAPNPAGEKAVVVVSTNPADYPAPVAEVEFGIQESDAVGHDYFDDTVFIGDSISLKLSHYARKMRQTDKDFLGSAKFLVAGSLGSGNALWKVSKESVHPSYQGTKMLLEDGVKAMGAEKVYIMLGMNDVALYGIDESVENMKTLIEKILKKSPDAEIFVQSATPRIAASKSRPTNWMLFEYDLKLYEMCAQQGWHFVDVASVMRDENGALKDEFCSDPDTMGMHFTDEACQIWVDYLLTHTTEMGEDE